MAAVFDDTLLHDVDFTGSNLAAASYCNAILAGARFDGAHLQSVDLDGAIVFAADPLAELAKRAHPETFRAVRYRQERFALTEVMQTGRTEGLSDDEPILAYIGNTPPWRLVRVSDF